MNAAIAVLLAPLKYLKARNPTKIYWDWVIPGLVALAGLLVLTLPAKPINIFGEKGLIHGVNELLQVLVGFYIAALAAIASLNNAALDGQVANEPVSCDGKNLTRRQLLSLMFSYMSFLAIAMYATGLFAGLVADPFKSLVTPEHAIWWRGGFAAVFCFFVTQLACITLVTLYYLGDRIHVKQAKAKPTVAKPLTAVPQREAANEQGP
jgi:hypothetical protein